MGRAVIGGLVVAIVAAIIFFIYSGQHRTQSAEQARQIALLNNELVKLQNENQQLTAALAKVQAEETSLAAQNDELKKAIASVKATGKLPPESPPPPK